MPFVETKTLPPQETVKTVQRSAVLSQLRDESALSNEDIETIASNIRTKGFIDTKRMLSEQGINIMRLDHPERPITTAKVDNLIHGFSLPLSRIAVTGLCLPERPTLQSLLPLLAIKSLLTQGILETDYIAIPLMAYAGAGLKRRFQYERLVGIAQELFHQRWGTQVFILPDWLLAEPKTKIGYLTSVHLTNELAQKKYPFPNLFSALETVGYATDAALVALAEQRSVTTVLDFRQFESIHGHIKTSKALGLEVGSLILTVLDPQTSLKGEITDITWENATAEITDHPLPEVSGLFLHALALAEESEITDLYQLWLSNQDRSAIRERIESARNDLTHSRFSINSRPETIESISLTRLRSTGVFERIDSLITDRFSQ